jgi:hypothetical protein
MKNQKALVRANGTSRRASGGRVRKTRAVEDQSAPIPIELNVQAWKGACNSSMRAVKGSIGHSLKRGVRPEKALVRANARLGVPAGGWVSKTRAVGDQSGHSL